MKKIYQFIVLLIVLCTASVRAQVLYSQTFSTSLGNCVASGGSNGNWIFSNNCSQSTAGGHSAPGHAIFSGSGCQFGNSSNTVSGDLTTPGIPIGASGGSLTFNYYVANECQSPGNVCTYDVLTLKISTNNGATWTSIMATNGAPAGLTQTSAWTGVTYNLNPYSNQTIMLRFNFNSLDGVANAYDGIYVDDIIVTGNCFINMAVQPGNSTVTPIICSGNSVTLTTSAVSNFSWSNGATTSSIVVSPTVNTTYSVSGTSTANCVSGASLAVVVNPGIPTLAIANTASASAGVCPSTSVTLNASGANTYSWSGSQAITNGVPFLPSGTGSYTVSGTNACGTTTAAVSISIHPVPSVTAIASQPTICSGNPVTINGVGTATGYVINGSVPNGSQLYPNSTQVYTVVGTNSLGCTTPAMVGVTVVTTPVAPPLASPPLICIGSSATLSSSGATNYTWTTPAGTQNTQTISVNPASSTIYTLTKANANCVNTQTVQVYVNLLPSVFAIASPTLVCASHPATLTGAGALTYTWTAPGYSATGGSPVVSPSVNTMYTVTASDGTCVNVTTVSVSTDPNPTITIVPTSTNICFGQSVSLTGTGAQSYMWSATGLTTTATNTTVAETPTASTLYQLTGQNAFNCTTSISQVVIVRTTPTLNIQTTKPMVCANGASGLTVTASGAGPFTYTWDPNANNATTSVTIVNPPATMVYTVFGTNSQTCSASKTIMVTVYSPTFAVNNPTSSCLGGTINLTASGANTYTWAAGGNFNFLPVSPPGPTVYLVSATSTSVGVSCVSTQSINVAIYQNPTVTAVATRTQICRTESTTVNAFGASSYMWNTSQTGSTVPVNPITNTIYTVTGTDQNGCLGTATVQVKTSTCIGLDKFAAATGLAVYPNPNNGQFVIRASVDCRLNLYSELGQLIGTKVLSAETSLSTDFTLTDAGVYFLSVESEGTVHTEKIVVTQ